MTDLLRFVAGQFQLQGDFVDGAPYGSGHINDTFAVNFKQGGAPIRYIFQRINHNIFKNPPALMENILRVTEHQRASLDDDPDASRKALTLIPATDGKCFVQDDEGCYWRCYIFIENARTYDIIKTTEQAYQAAKAFGGFQKLLVDIPGGRLMETIPDFHNTPSRFANLVKAIESDAAGRAKDVKDEIDFALSRARMARHLLELNSKGEIPERVTHNDTKLNNVMLDDATSEGICVIDLDTVMPGLALYDFGDLVRTSTSPAAEDERDLSKVFMQMEMFKALAAGYLSSASDFLTPAEIDNLAFCGKLISFEIGLRFLTDHLEGDVYFKTHRDNHNLDRCRTQFKLVQSIEDQEEDMRRIVKDLS